MEGNTVQNRHLISLILRLQNGTFFAAVITAFKLAFCGFLALWNHIPFVMRPFTYLSTHSYGLEALVLSVYDQNRDDIKCPDDVFYCHYKWVVAVIAKIHDWWQTPIFFLFFFVPQESKNDHTRARHEFNKLRHRCFHYFRSFAVIQNIGICDA